jgi:probable HAF family extracellular repeat protein
LGVSADGSVVVGLVVRPVNNYRNEASRWTQSSEAVGLGFLSDNVNLGSFANDVSADGSVVVGGSSTNTGDTSISPFRWTQETGMVALGSYPDGWSGGYDFANASVSADGSVIVGYVNDYKSGNGAKAFRWTQPSGIVGLGNLPGGFDSIATDVSADGSVIVGQGSSVNGREAFRWTQETGMVGLGTVPSGGSIGSFLGISADSTVIVGYDHDYNTARTEAFRWTQETGMVGLGTLGESRYGAGQISTSADGSIIVGTSADEAFRWTQKTGMVSLKETLIGAGLDVSGWTLMSANAISANGFTIVGDGTNPSGKYEAWIANVSPEPVPEPLTIVGSMAAIAFAAGFERKFNKNKSDEKDPDA